MMTSYASCEHWRSNSTVGKCGALGGDGLDWQKLMEEVRLRQSLGLDAWVQFLRGYFYDSPRCIRQG